MALIRSEISKYKDIVLALNREIHNRGQKEVAWDTFSHLESTYTPHSCIIGKASEELKSMGFLPTFTYDKEHLKNAMFPEGGLAPHAHGMTPEELLRLPYFLNHPVAIVTERNDKTRMVGDKEYRCLHFICATKDDDGQKYYRAVVHPYTHHNGLLTNGYVSKVISFHKIDENRFEAMMNGVLNGDRQMLYFDNRRYLEIDSETKPIEFYNYASGSLPIKGHFTTDPNLHKISQMHKVAVQSAVTAEINKLIVGKNTRGESFPILTSSLKALAHGSSFETIQSAYCTVNKISQLTNDRVLGMRLQEYADKSFARSYIRLLSPEQKQFTVEQAANRISSMDVRSQDDIQNVCNEISKTISSMPTLKNLKINFSDRLAKLPIIMEAREISGQFQNDLENRFASILKEKCEQLKRLEKAHGLNTNHDKDIDHNSIDIDIDVGRVL